MTLGLLTIAVPALMLVYGVSRWFDGRDGDYGPGAAWNIGHVAFFVAFAGFGALTVHFWRSAARSHIGKGAPPVLVLAALVVMGANLDLLPLTAALLGVGLVPVGLAHVRRQTSMGSA